MYQIWHLTQLTAMLTTVEIKRKLEVLRDSMYQNHAIYHERVTLLVQITQFDINETRVNFKALIVKPLDMSHAESNRLYQNMQRQNELTFSAAYSMGKEGTSLSLENSVLSRPYCPFTLFLDPELARFVLDNEDEITKIIPRYILWGKDWKELRK